jgi:predicted helicase
MGRVSKYPEELRERAVRMGHQGRREADCEIASMDEKAEFVPVFHRLPFGEAIERGLLTDYQLVIVGVDDATFREWVETGAVEAAGGSQGHSPNSRIKGLVNVVRYAVKGDCGKERSLTSPRMS